MDRRWRSKKRAVEQCRFVAISAMNKAGMFRQGPGHFWTVQWTNSQGKEVGSVGCWVGEADSGGLYLQLGYMSINQQTGETQDHNYPIQLAETRCNFGGTRYWFVCPLEKNGVPCGRRVGKLYMPPREMYFGCRHCYNLTYKSCQEHDGRLGAIMRLPPQHLIGMMESKNPKHALLGVRAYFKLLDKLDKGKKR